MVAVRLGRYQESMDRLARAREHARRLHLDSYESVLLGRLGSFALAMGDVGRADEMMSEALELAERTRFANAEAFALVGRAIVRRNQGRFDEAVESAHAAAALFEKTGQLTAIPQALSTIGFAAQQRGDARTADELHRRALAVARRANTLSGVALAVEGLAGVAMLEGRWARAATLLGAARAARDVDGGGLAGPESEARAIEARVMEMIDREAFAAAFAAGTTASLDDLVG
jgi:tetratricopeptide (TPR) repeat protein